MARRSRSSLTFVDDGPTLGQMIRAARLRWGWSPRVWGFVRLSMDSPRFLRVECHPVALVPSDSRSDRNFLIWWEASTDVIEMISPLRYVTRIRRRFEFRVEVDT